MLLSVVRPRDGASGLLSRDLRYVLHERRVAAVRRDSRQPLPRSPYIREME